MQQHNSCRRWAWAVMVIVAAASRGVAGQTIAEEVDRPVPSAEPSAVVETRAEAATVASGFDGYDFSYVVDRLQTSVDPLQQEMNGSFRQFAESVANAEQLLEEGKTREAVQACADAIEGVMDSRDDVLGPMWEGQEFLQNQVSEVRHRLAEALEAADQGGEVRLDQRVEGTLDGIAKRIAAEANPVRKKRLVSHYRTVRNLAQIKQMTRQMSPDRRKLWTNVLHLLEEASLGHQQVLMGSEVLFAQFEATSSNIQEYLTLLDTVDGASELLGVVRGVDGQSTGMTAFAHTMRELQQQLAGFNEAVETALQTSMFELEAQVDALQPMADVDAAGVVSASVDDELAARIDRVTQTTLAP